MNLRATLGLLAVVLCASAVAQDGAVEKYRLALGGEFEFHQTDHWIIAYSSKKEHAEQVGDALEKLYKVFVATFEEVGLELNTDHEPLEVVLYKDRKAYDDHQSKRVRPQSIPSDGAYSPGSNRIVMIVPGSQRISSLINLAVHEGTHQLAFNLGVQNRRESYPPWLGEGLASAFETRDLDAEFGPLSSIRNPRWRNMALRAETGRTMPLAELIVLRRPNMEPEAEQARDTMVDNSAIYNQGASVVTFMLREYPEQFVQYLRALEDLPRFRDPTSTWQEAFKKSFGDVEDFEKQWKEWLTKQDSHR